MLSQAEVSALEMIKSGSILVTQICEKNTPAWHGGIIPGKMENDRCL